MHDPAHAHMEQETYSKEEAIALLNYMIDHNKHHEEELHQLAHSFIGEAESLIHDAIIDFKVGNEKLIEALKIVQGG